MLNDHARAEEVVADTLYEVWRHPTRFRGDSQFSTWLIGIARRKALMVYRARRPDEVHGDLDDIAETTASDAPDAFAELAGKQRREGVQHCMKVGNNSTVIIQSDNTFSQDADNSNHPSNKSLLLAAFFGR